MLAPSARGRPGQRGTRCRGIRHGVAPPVALRQASLGVVFGSLVCRYPLRRQGAVGGTVGVLPFAGVSAIPQPDDPITDVLAVRQEQESTRHRPCGRDCRQQLGTLCRLAPGHRPRPGAAADSRHVNGPGGPRHERVLRVGAGTVGVHLRSTAGRGAGSTQRRQLGVHPLGDLAQRKERGVRGAEPRPRMPVRQPAPECPDVCADDRHAAGLVPPWALPEAVLRVFFG
eukprot:5019767-Lingulodinium_polyedra.AAC.1